MIRQAIPQAMTLQAAISKQADFTAIPQLCAQEGMAAMAIGIKQDRCWL
jgi:hypothetical protein